MPTLSAAAGRIRRCDRNTAVNDDTSGLMTISGAEMAMPRATASLPASTGAASSTAANSGRPISRRTRSPAAKYARVGGLLR